MIVIYDSKEKNKRIILMSVYIPCIRNQQEKVFQWLVTQFFLIKQVYTIEKKVNVDLKLILTGNLNY